MRYEFFVILGIVIVLSMIILSAACGYVEKYHSVRIVELSIVYTFCEDKVVCYGGAGCFRDADLIQKYCGQDKLITRPLVVEGEK